MSSPEHLVSNKMFTHACPFQSQVYSCRLYLDSDETTGSGYKTSRKKFTPSTCSINEFRPKQFLTLLRNKRLMFSGDSMSMQNFIMVACSLHVEAESEYSKEWCIKPECAEGAEHCQLVTAKVFYPEYNTTIVFLGTQAFDYNSKHHGEHDLIEYIDYGQLWSPFDILLLNVGLHASSRDWLSKVTQKISEQYNCTKPDQRPILIWRETSAQHFDTESDGEPSGYFNYPNKEPCVQHSDFDKAYLEDYRNRIPERWMNRYQIPILRINNASSLAMDQHFGLHPRIKYTDCTHFCDQSGVLYFFRDLLYEALPFLLEEKKEELARFQEHPEWFAVKQKIKIAALG